jgi:methionyl-tRNA formyltransferase
MRLAFIAAGEIALPSLRAVAKSFPAHQLVALVTQPDRPCGRRAAPVSPPAKRAGQELGLAPERIFQPKSINSPRFLARLRALEPDLFLVMAYGQILRSEALALPKFFSLNAHLSLLPSHRGASPIEAALLAGDTRTGVTVFELRPALDAGPMLLSRELPISPDHDRLTLGAELSELAAECFLEALERIAAGRATFAPQDERLATYAPKLTKESGRLDWTRPAAYLERCVRAFAGWPGAWTCFHPPAQSSRFRRLRVLHARLADSEMPGAGKDEPGLSRAAGAAPEGGPWLEACCGDGRRLRLLRVQPEGGRAMSAAEFLHGAGRGCAAGCRLQ